MNLNFCPNCGNATLHQNTTTEYECATCGQFYWNNPKATVAIIFMRDDQVLYSQRARAPHQGKFDFPGGFLEYGEDVRAACVREILEETTVRIKAEDLEYFSNYSGEYVPGISWADTMFIVRNWEGEFTASDDSTALEWHSISFMSSDQFVPHYKQLQTKLEALARKSSILKT